MRKIFKITILFYFLINIFNFSIGSENFFNKGLELYNKKKFEEQGYAIVKNVLNFDNDLKPILNDMEYVMDRLIHKFSPKPKIAKALKLKFEKKYQFVSSLNIFDLDQYFYLLALKIVLLLYHFFHFLKLYFLFYY